MWRNGDRRYAAPRAASRSRADARAVDAVTRAVVDLPTSAVRRHVAGEGAAVPGWLAEDVASAARVLLERIAAAPRDARAR